MDNGAKPWVNRAMSLLVASLEHPRQELNELDWKEALSAKKDRLGDHIIAFANHPGGGFMVFGIDDRGVPRGVEESDVKLIVGRLANIGRNALAQPVTIENASVPFAGSTLLLIHVRESAVKPVHRKATPIDETFIRSGGTTRTASRPEVGNMLMNSRTPRWEEIRATVLLPVEEVMNHIDPSEVFEMLERPRPSSHAELMRWLEGEHFIEHEPSGGAYVTNLGAIATARALSSFGPLARKAVRVIKYDGHSKSSSANEIENNQGYAIRFSTLLKTITSLLPQSEIIKDALRTEQPVYPTLALREILANALIHQDFTVQGAGPLIEIYEGRIEISNPGTLLPSKQLDRLLGTQPESRNEQLAKSFRRYKICEERGSGLIKAATQIELYGLPPIKFENGQSFFKVTLFSPRSFIQMSSEERLNACYQHTVLQHLSGNDMTNTSLRKRLHMSEKQRTQVSLLIQDALDVKLIKPSNPESTSRKFAGYRPYWA